MAGIQLTDPRRSELLSQLLKKQHGPKRQIESGAQLVAELGEQFLRKKRLDRLQEEENTSQNEIAEALRQGRATAPQSVEFEQIEGEQGLDPRVIPGRREIGSETEDAISALSPSQQVQARQLQAMQRNAAEPTASEAAKIDFERQLSRDDRQAAAVLERERLRDHRQAIAQEKQNEFAGGEAEKDRIHQDTRDIRAIQAEVELTRLEKELTKDTSIDGLKLNEQEAKATSWVISAEAGMDIVQRELDTGYSPSIHAVALYAKSIDPDTGAGTRVEIRNAIPQRALNFLDATNMFVDPFVRSRTGAAVRTDEFITTFNSHVGIGTDEQELANKQFFRQESLASIQARAGRGMQLVEQRRSSRQLPQQEMVIDGPDIITEDMSNLAQEILDQEKNRAESTVVLGK